MSISLPIADLFQALADPSRVRILMLLRTMELSVGELAQVLGQSQPRVSRHVKILGDAGLLARHKEGSWVFLALTDDLGTLAVFDLVDRWLDEGSRDVLAADAVRLAAVRADRTEAAQRSIEGFGGRLIFYAYCFGEWDGIAIAEFPNHEAAMASLLALNSAGALSKTQTTVLLSSEETVRSMQKAHDTKTGYTPPG